MRSNSGRIIITYNLPMMPVLVGQREEGRLAQQGVHGNDVDYANSSSGASAERVTASHHGLDAPVESTSSIERNRAVRRSR